jgi:hypothetical protein
MNKSTIENEQFVAYFSYDAINTYDGEYATYISYQTPDEDERIKRDLQQMVSTRDHGESWRNLTEKIVS